MKTKHGAWTVDIPTHDNEVVRFGGLCLDKITGTFANYPLRGQVEDDIKAEYKAGGGNPDDLPKLPSHIGGSVDFMIGIKYLRYHPKEIFQTLSGLTIYESPFENAHGGRGVIGGPHWVFTRIEEKFYQGNNHMQSIKRTVNA